MYCSLNARCQSNKSQPVTFKFYKCNFYREICNLLFNKIKLFTIYLKCIIQFLKLVVWIALRGITWLRDNIDLIWFHLFYENDQSPSTRTLGLASTSKKGSSSADHRPSLVKIMTSVTKPMMQISKMITVFFVLALGSLWRFLMLIPELNHRDSHWNAGRRLYLSESESFSLFMLPANGGSESSSERSTPRL